MRITFLVQRTSRQLAHFACLVMFCGILGVGEVAIASTEREESLETLRTIDQAFDDFEFEMGIDPEKRGPIKIGEKIRYWFRPADTTFAIVIHVDAHGVGTLFWPGGTDASRRLEGGVRTLFPPRPDPPLKVVPPIGGERLFAIATSTPIAPAHLGVIGSRQGIVVVEAVDLPGVTRRLADLLDANRMGLRSVATLSQQIVGHGDGVEYVSDDIVRYLAERTRSIQRPKLDLHIGFETDSAKLDDAARASLRIMADALSNSRIKSMRFTIAGHTDDVGPDAYNKQLSIERARTTTRFLTEELGLSAARFRIQGYGESRPMDPGKTAQARRLNRRVEFEVIPN